MDPATSQTDRLLLFVPCYNCQAQIPRVIEQAGAAPTGLIEEVLVVDNGSRDDTIAAAVDALARAPHLRGSVVRNLDNYGLGGSHKAAFAYATRNGFSHVIVLHGDDQAELQDVLLRLAQGEHRKVDALLGSRFMRGARTAGYSGFRQLGNYVFNGLFTLVAGAQVDDLGSGLNVFSHSVFADQRVAGFADDLRFNVYLLLGMIAAGRRIAFFPISWREEDQVSNVRIVSQSFKTLQIAAGYMLARRRFLERDHRSLPRQAYPFEIAARQDGLGAARAGAA